MRKCFLVDMELDEVLRRLEHDSYLAIEWFQSNYMKLNEGKCHFLLAGHRFEQLWIDVGNSKIWESNSKRMLGILIDNKMKFDKHVNEICKIAGRKLTALARLAKILPHSKMKILIKSFFDSQFAYCPLIWMFHGRTTNQKINKLHERSLRILYKDDTSSFEELLRKDKSVTMHVRNLRHLAVVMYKVYNNLAPSFIVEIFPKHAPARILRNNRDFSRPNVNTVQWGTESVRNLGPIIWNFLPKEIKYLPTIASFTQNIRSWQGEGCPCRLCTD